MDTSPDAPMPESPLAPARRQTTKPHERVFLSAAWRNLVMLNYEIDPSLLVPYLPVGLEIDSFQGATYVSLVGFQFLDTRLFGAMALPWHTNFDEINLRFYVRRRASDRFRRGVVFIKEIVPRLAIAWAARQLYGENYSCHPMRHTVHRDESVIRAEYQCKIGENRCRLHARASGEAALPAENSLAEFITEHYWGYTRRGPRSFEYHVAHPRWQVWDAEESGCEGAAQKLYGASFAGVLRRPPVTAFIAEGSKVEVFNGRVIH